VLHDQARAKHDGGATAMCFGALPLPGDLLVLLSKFLWRRDITALHIAGGKQGSRYAPLLVKLLGMNMLHTKEEAMVARDDLHWEGAHCIQNGAFVPRSLKASYARVNEEWDRIEQARLAYGRGTALDAANCSVGSIYVHKVKMRRSSPGCRWEQVHVVSMEIDNKHCVLVLAQTQQCFCSHDTSYGRSTWDADCFYGCPGFVTVHLVRPLQRVYNKVAVFGYQGVDGRDGPIEATFFPVNQPLSLLGITPTSFGLGMHLALLLVGFQIRGHSPVNYVDPPTTPVRFCFSCAGYDSRHVRPANPPKASS